MEYDPAVYCGPLRELEGRTAWVRPDDIEVVTAEENQRRKIQGHLQATALDANNPFVLAAALRSLGFKVPRITLEDGTTELETEHAIRRTVAARAER